MNVNYKIRISLFFLICSFLYLILLFNLYIVQIKNKDFYFMFLKRKLNEEQLKLVQNIKDIHILKEPSRFYSIECAGIVIGLTDIDNNGLFGIEKEFDDLLKGKPTK